MGRIRDALGRLLLGDLYPKDPPATLSEIEALRADMAALRAASSNLQLEWAEVLDKINHWAARQAKRDQRAIKAALSNGDGEAKAPTTPRERARALARERGLIP